MPKKGPIFRTNVKSKDNTSLGINCNFINNDNKWETSDARYGVSTGKVFYEGKCTGSLNVMTKQKSICRMGWSREGHQHSALGIVEGSFGYGETFGSGDVIGCAIDFESRNISYFKNGIPQGIAFLLPDEDRTYVPTYAAICAGIDLNYGCAPFQFPIEGYVGFAMSDKVPIEYSNFPHIFKFRRSGLRSSEEITLIVADKLEEILKTGGQQLSTKFINLSVNHRPSPYDVYHIQPGDSFLHVASRTNNIPLIRLLMFSGIVIKTKNKWGRMAADVEGADITTRYLMLLHAKFQHNIKEVSDLMREFSPVKWKEGFIDMPRFTTDYLEGDIYNREYKLFRESSCKSFFIFINRLKGYLQSPALFPGQDEKTRADQQEAFLSNKAVKVLFNPDYQYLINLFL